MDLCEFMKLESYDEIKEYYETNKDTLISKEFISFSEMAIFLKEACYNGNCNMIKYLCSIGGHSTMERAFNLEMTEIQMHGDIIKFCIENDDELKKNILNSEELRNKCFYILCNLENFEYAKWYYNYIGNINIDYNDVDEYISIDNIILQKYMKKFDWKESSYGPLLIKYNIYSNIYGIYTPLVSAIYNGDLNKCKWLYSKRANVHICWDFPFKLAVIQNDIAIIEWLLIICPEFKKYIIDKYIINEDFYGAVKCLGIKKTDERRTADCSICMDSCEIKLFDGCSCVLCPECFIKIFQGTNKRCPMCQTEIDLDNWHYDQKTDK